MVFPFLVAGRDGNIFQWREPEYEGLAVPVNGRCLDANDVGCARVTAWCGTLDGRLMAASCLWCLGSRRCGVRLLSKIATGSCRPHNSRSHFSRAAVQRIKL